MDLRQTYNKIAEDWNEDHKDDPWPHDDAREFSSYLKKNDKVLDIGCGSGLKAKVMQEKGLKVMGIDISDKMIELAKKKSPKSSFFVMDMRDVGNFKNLFDGIFAQAAFLHIPKNEIHSVFKKVVAKLKNKGFIYIALKGKRIGGKEEEILKEGEKILVVDWKKDSPLGPKEKVSPEEIKKIAEEIDLKPEKEFEASAYHYGLIFTK